MFGLEKKKQKKKTVKKVSAASARSRKNKDSAEKKSAKKIAVKKRGSLNVGGKYFDSPDQVSAYYRAEGERVKKALKNFKVAQVESYLGVAKGSLMKLLSQKKNLESVANDLEKHKSLLNNKVAELNSQKEKGEVHKRKVQGFVNKMKKLELEAKKIFDIRDDLLHKESDLIVEMKKMAKLAQRDLDLTDVKTANELAEFEVSKEAVLVRAKELLSEEATKLFSDNALLNRLDNKATKRISELNNQLAKIHGAKKETLKKRHILEISEKETAEKLAQAEAKVKKLEERYQDLLKK